MTTIAFDGKSLAVDSQATVDDVISSLECKKLFTDVGEFKAVAITGNIVMIALIILWLEDEAKPEDVPKGDWAAICITQKNKLVRYTSDKPYPDNFKAPYTDGSGWRIALGALKAGATAKQALDITKELCIFTGGKTRVFNCER